MAERVDINKIPDAEALAMIRAFYRVDNMKARFILALARGEIQGDIEMPGDRRRRTPGNTED